MPALEQKVRRCTALKHEWAWQGGYIQCRKCKCYSTLTKRKPARPDRVEL